MIKRVFSALVKRLYLFVCFFMPLDKNKIIISSFFGKGFSDSPKYIAEKVHSLNPEIKIIWLINSHDEEASLPPYVESCLNTSLKSIYHYMTSLVWIDNCRKSYYYKKKKTLYIQTWHGGLPIKKIERDAISQLGKHYEKKAKKDSKQIDVYISESAFMTSLYKSSFWYNGLVLECGSPRYDELFSPACGKNQFLSKNNISQDSKLILYAPTFRNNRSFEPYNLDFKKIKYAFDRKFGGDHTILMRLHPNISHLSANLLSNDFVNVTNYPDVQDLVKFCDYVISDYSSILLDFAVLNKPAFRIALDYKDYICERNFYFNFKDYPYPFAFSIDDFLLTISNFKLDQYLKNVDSFFKKTGFIKNGNSSQVCASLICDYCSNKKGKSELLKYYAKKY